MRRGLRGVYAEKGEKMYNILVCDDEKDIVSALEIYLTADLLSGIYGIQRKGSRRYIK